MQIIGDLAGLERARFDFLYYWRRRKNASAVSPATVKVGAVKEMLLRKKRFVQKGASLYLQWKTRGEKQKTVYGQQIRLGFVAATCCISKSIQLK